MKRLNQLRQWPTSQWWSWLSLVTLATVTLLPGVASAFNSQATNRTTTLSSSAASASNSITVTFTANYTTGSPVTKAITLETCTSPLQSTTCTSASATTGSFSAAAFTSTGSSANLASFTSSFSSGRLIVSNSTGVTQSSATTYTLKINGFVNPSNTNQQFYIRATTWTDTGATAPANGNDYGAMAVSTTQTLTVAANVQESLVFCTGTSGSDCSGISGSTVNIGSNPGTDNVLQLGATTGGISKMFVTTNAASGYTLSYVAAALASGGNQIASASNQTLATCSSGSTNGDCFGINVTGPNASVTGSAAITGTSGFTAPTVTSGYGTADTYSFSPGSSAVTVASTSSPTVQTDYVVSYAARAGTTTKPGSYSTTFTWICTGTF